MGVVTADGHDITANCYFGEKRVRMAQITAGADAKAVDKQLEFSSHGETDGIRNAVPPILPISAVSARRSGPPIGSRDTRFANGAGQTGLSIVTLGSFETRITLDAWQSLRARKTWEANGASGAWGTRGTVPAVSTVSSSWTYGSFRAITTR